MQFRTIFLHTLKRYRLLTIGVAIGAALWAAFVLALYPSFSDTLQNFNLPGAMSGITGEANSYSSAAGFLTGEFFSLATILIMAIGVVGGTGAVSGEEAAGTLDLLLAQPLKRSTLLLAEFAALALLLVIPVVASAIGLLAVLPFIDADLTSKNLAAACANMWPVSLLFLGISMLCSAAMASRGSAAGLVAVFIVASFLLTVVGADISALETVRKISPFYWSDPARVLLHGFHWTRSALLALAAFPFLGASIWYFNQRDIAVGEQMGHSLSAILRHTPTPEKESKPQPTT